MPARGPRAVSCGPPRDEAPAIPPQSKPSTAAMPIPDIANATCAPLQSPTPSASPAAQARGCTAAVTHIMVSGWPRRRRPPSRICAARRLTVFVAHIAMQRHCRGPPAPSWPASSELARQLRLTHPSHFKSPIRPPAESFGHPQRSQEATTPRRHAARHQQVRENQTPSHRPPHAAALLGWWGTVRAGGLLGRGASRWQDGGGGSGDV